MIKNLLSVFIIIFKCLSLKATMSYDPNAEANKFYIRWPEWMINDNFSELSIEDLKNKNTNEISKEMVQRRSLELSKENSNGYDFMSNSTILLNFPSYLTKKIAENGFLNQHQTSTGLGNANQEQPRDLLEQGLYKTRFPNLLNEDQSLVKKINQIRPKSSFIQFNDVKNNLSQSRSYGDILAGFTSRDIKERTVFTEIDSLGLLSAVEKDINSIKVTPLIAKGLDKPVDINMGYREALIAGEITMDQVDYFLVGCKLPYYRKTSDDYSSESYYNDVNHKKDFVDTLYYLLDKNYKVFGCNINTKNEGYEKGEEITKNNLFDSAYLSAYLKIIEKKVNKIIKPQIKGLNTEITITTESLKKDKAEINNDKINAEEKSYYKNKIEKHKKLLKENIEKLNELHKLDEKNKKDLKTLIID